MMEYLKRKICKISADNLDIYPRYYEENGKTGLVTHAVRDAQMNGVTVKEGDFIGRCGKDIICATDSNVSAACDMTEKLGGDDFDIIIVIKGKNATKEDADAVAEKLTSSCSMAEIISMDGGQDVYDFIIIYE